MKKIYKGGELKSFLKNIYCFKIDRLIRFILSKLLKPMLLKNVIIIESHNDFDCNGGAFYKYLLDNNFNKKYKIVWLLKNPLNTDLPENVEAFMIRKPNIKKDYYMCIAKYVLSDNYIFEKCNPNQVFVYCTHGAGGLKNVKGNLVIPKHVDYVLFQSPRYAKIQAEQYSMEYPSKRILYLGYPVHDVLNSNNNELLKITDKNYKKTIIWMPTFRKKAGYLKREDSTAKQPLGIPLILTKKQYLELNKYLNELDVLMIIKLHPMQDISDIEIEDCSNIKILTGKSVKELCIDNYRLMSCTDAMISDYSGVAYEYLQLNRPIAYVLSDKDEYKLGFVVEDISSLMAGPEIYVYEDLIRFIADVAAENDPYKTKRENLRDFIYEYHDTNNCERLAAFLKL